MHKSKHDWSHLNNQKGVSIAEALIGLVMLMGFVLAMSSFLIGSKNIEMKLEGSGLCRAKAQEVLNNFKAFDNKLVVSNWHANSNPGETAKPPALGFQHPERFLAFNIVDDVSDVTFSKTNTFMLINNATNWALALYNAGGYCNTAGLGKQLPTPPAGAPPIPSTADYIQGWPYYPLSEKLKGEKIFLNIKRVDLRDPSVKDCLRQGVAGPPAIQGSLKIVPIGLKNAATIEAQSGLELTATVQTLDPNSNQPQQCVATTILKVEGDGTPASSAQLPDDVKPTASCPGAKCACLKDSGGRQFTCLHDAGDSTWEIRNIMGEDVAVTKSDLSSVQLKIGVASNEPAVALGCRYVYNEQQPPTFSTSDGTYKACSSFEQVVLVQNGLGSEFPGNPANLVTGVINKISSNTNGITGVRIDMSNNLAIGYHTLWVKAFDSAQNENVLPVRFCKAYCPAPSSYYPCELQEPNADYCGRPCPVGTKNPKEACPSCAPGGATILDACGDSCGIPACPVPKPCLPPDYRTQSDCLAALPAGAPSSCCEEVGRCWVAQKPSTTPPDPADPYFACLGPQPPPPLCVDDYWTGDLTQPCCPGQTELICKDPLYEDKHTFSYNEFWCSPSFRVTGKYPNVSIIDGTRFRGYDRRESNTSRPNCRTGIAGKRCIKPGTPNPPFYFKDTDGSIKPFCMWSPSSGKW